MPPPKKEENKRQKDIHKKYEEQEIVCPNLNNFTSNLVKSNINKFHLFTKYYYIYDRYPR